MKRTYSRVTKESILSRIDQYQVVYGCDRQRAFIFLRDEHPELWELLGQFFRAEADERTQAA